jgi:hypothetical protein
VSPTSEAAPAALNLGVDIEEVYTVFGEGQQLAGRGLDDAAFALVERKTQRVQDRLLDLGMPHDLVQRFQSAASHAVRAGDPLPGGIEGLFAATKAAASELSGLMGEIRGHLTPDDGALYDLGVMLARLDLCLRIVVSAGDRPAVSELRTTYLTELQRVVPIVHDFLAAARFPLERAAPERLARQLGNLGWALERWDGGSEGWCREAHTFLDRVFETAGFTTSGPAEPEEAPESAGGDDFVRSLVERKEEAQRLFSTKEYAEAERVQKDLIVRCSQTIGPAHPFTLAVRGDLCMTLLGLRRADLAVDLAYDLADDAEQTLGPRHAATAEAQVRALFVLMSTREFAEVIDFHQAKLAWLEAADPATLQPELQPARQRLLELTGRDPA